MTESILTVLVPAYDSLGGVVRIIEALELRENVGVVVSDDSPDLVVADAIKSYVTSFKRNDYYYIRHDGTGNAIDNWNFLLSKVQGQFFALVHHDETFSNTLFIDEIVKNKDTLELMVLPARIEHPNGVYRNVKSSLQMLLIKIFRASSPTLNFIGAPTACLIVNSKRLCDFNRDLVFYVDNDWYLKLFASISRGSLMTFSKTTVVSSITDHSITKSLQYKMKETIDSDVEVLKKSYPTNIFLKNKVNLWFLRFSYRFILIPSFIPYYLKKIKSSFFD